MTEPRDLRPIVSNFQMHGEFLSAQPYGSGHINDTYAAAFNQGGAPIRYIVQRINHQVFRDPPAVMENIQRVTDHLRKKWIKSGAQDISRRVMTVIPTCDGASYHVDETGAYWRAYIFIENAQTYDTLTSEDQAYQAARMFGLFQKMLADLPQPPLHETIPDFHNGQKRYQTFLDTLQADRLNRAATAREEIAFVIDHAWIFDVLPDLVAKGEIPVRCTHNDTKINNVMLDDATGEGLCVIDLDTLMPGLSLYDFGDIVRTTTSPAAEDERDLSRVTMRMSRFEAVVRGFLEMTGDALTPAEREHLVLAGQLITLIIGARFLTDYLAGDQYFKVRREGHNLDRSRTQLRLVRSIRDQEAAMRALIERL